MIRVDNCPPDHVPLSYESLEVIRPRPSLAVITFLVTFLPVYVALVLVGPIVRQFTQNGSLFPFRVDAVRPALLMGMAMAGCLSVVTAISVRSRSWRLTRDAIYIDAPDDGALMVRWRDIRSMRFRLYTLSIRIKGRVLTRRLVGVTAEHAAHVMQRWRDATAGD